MIKTAIAPRNYLDKMDEFLAHWPVANTAFGSAILLSGGYAVANLTTDRAAILAQLAVVETKVNVNQAASEARDIARAALRERMRQFNQSIRAFWPNSIYSNQLPKLPGITNGLGVWVKAMQDVADIWSQINALEVVVGMPIPLTLIGGYTRATFVTDQAALTAAYAAVNSAELNAEQARKLRDQLWYPIFQRLKQYRVAIQARFLPDTATFDSLPALSPPAGSTPDAVNVSASWDLTISKAVLTFTASTDPAFARYDLRACFGSRYKVDEEQVLDSITDLGATRRFETDEGLVASGSKVFYKVYVVLTTENEKGSRAVSVTRP